MMKLHPQPALAAQTSGLEAVPPSKWLLLREASAVTSRVSGMFAVNRLAAQFAPTCDGRPVMLVPGFLSSPAAMLVLRRALKASGYRVRDWGMGRNFGPAIDTLDRLAVNVAAMAAKYNGPVTLIGWSLGGVYARELAKRRPELVREVLTLGTPFSAHPRANNAWRVYERVTGHAVDSPPIVAVTHEKPPVPTTAFWSRNDGVISPASARGLSGERDSAVELDCGHLSFASKPSAVLAILTHLQGGHD